MNVLQCIYNHVLESPTLRTRSWFENHATQGISLQLMWHDSRNINDGG